MPERLGEIKVNGKRVASGTEVTLKSRPGLKRGRYNVAQIERTTSGKVILSVVRLARMAERWHYVYPEQIETVHRSKKHE